MVATVTPMLKLHPYGSCREERQGPQLAIFHRPRHSAGTEAIRDKPPSTPLEHLAVPTHRIDPRRGAVSISIC